MCLPLPAAPETVFTLYQNLTAAEKPTFTSTVSFLVQFDQSVRGLRVGAPVEFRGIEIGEVTDVRLEFDPELDRFRIPVTIEVEPERVGHVPLGERKRHEALDQLVKSGLRAQLKSGNLLTGQLVVYLDIYQEPASGEDGVDRQVPGDPDDSDAAGRDHREPHAARGASLEGARRADRPGSRGRPQSNSAQHSRRRRTSGRR